MEDCTRVESFDYFNGSETAYIVSIIIVLGSVIRECVADGFSGLCTILSTRPEGPRCKARRVKSGVGFFWEEQPAPSPPARGSGGALQRGSLQRFD